MAIEPTRSGIIGTGALSRAAGVAAALPLWLLL